MSLPHFWSTVRRKSSRFEHIPVIQTRNSLDYFCIKRVRTLNSYQLFKIKNKKYKIHSDWCPFQGLSSGTTLVQIQSDRTVPLICVFSTGTWKHEGTSFSWNSLYSCFKELIRDSNYERKYRRLYCTTNIVHIFVICYSAINYHIFIYLFIYFI